MNENKKLTHINGNGKAKMVDISGKGESLRTAEAAGSIRLDRNIIARIKENDTKKGDVLAVAKIAGINAAKKTWELIPLCHQVKLTGIDIDFKVIGDRDSIEVRSRVSAHDSTGVEMEAITAVSVSLLTIYDMCKAMSKNMEIGPVYLVKKTGGRSDYLKK